MKKLLKDKAGMSYVFVCMILLSLCIIVGFAIQYVQIFSTIRYVQGKTENEAQTIAREMIENNYLGIKQGTSKSYTLGADNNIDSNIDNSEIAEQGFSALASSLNAEVKGSEIIKEDTTSVYYKLTDVTISVDNPDLSKKQQLSVTISYTINVPLMFYGKSYAPISIPRTVTYQYDAKK